MGHSSDGWAGDIPGPPMSTGALPEGGLVGLLGPPDQSAAEDAGNILARLSGLPGPAQNFTIDIELAPQAIADLEAAAVFLERRADSVQAMTWIPAPGVDEISLHAVEQIGKWAADNSENNLYATLRTGAEQLRVLVAKLKADLQTYLQVDELDLPPASDGLPQ